ncbi:MAG: polymer-forming cytoskeletal protein [Bacteroidota bacterium]|nr:polymer-forming cytoskeletal protein [Bacteroidota bacterium]
MFNSSKTDKTMSKGNEVESTSINLIGAGTVIKGDIKSNGDVRIDGTLYGSVITKGKLVVGTTGVIEGEVTCQNADFSGMIKAQINVSELLSLKSTAKLIGDIVTNKLSIEPGANFSGSCSMNNPPKEIPVRDNLNVGNKYAEKQPEPLKIKETIK